MIGNAPGGALIALSGLAAAGTLLACRYLRVRTALGSAARRSFRRRAFLFLGAGGLAAAAFTVFSGSLALPPAPALILGIVAFRAFIREAGKGER
jgi:hypothetical protein